MSDLFENHIVGFLTRRLKYIAEVRYQGLIKFMLYTCTDKTDILRCFIFDLHLFKRSKNERQIKTEMFRINGD